jgi:hypothetical protein
MECGGYRIFFSPVFPSQVNKYHKKDIINNSIEKLVKPLEKLKKSHISTNLHG